ncbi:MAG: DUF1559 domain-containing protein [Gemmataceae bacterium]
MMVRARLLLWLFSLLAVAVFLVASSPLEARDKEAVAGRRPWTLDDALNQLRLYPRDAYLQYVALQLGRQEKRTDEVIQKIRGAQGIVVGRGGNERAQRVDLFNLFSGALAVQESLQLDTMRGDQPGRPVPRKGEEDGASVSVAKLAGPRIQSHPWQKMLAGRKPDVGRLARHVPEDFYFIEFRSVVKLMEVMDQSDLWGTHLFHQTVQEARTQLVGERMKKQLAIETTKLLQPFYDAIVRDVAVTGSDLYLREGSDVTLLFGVKQPEVFKLRMDSFLTQAEKANPGARRTEGEYKGIRYVHVATSDRAVHVYSAYPTPDLHVRSNSLVGLRRVLDAIEGKGVRRLGDSDEFAYIRTLMPRGAKEEDGFVYLSDPFIRRLVGPGVKLTERRRMLCFNHLKMISHAALFYRTQYGKAPASLEELAKTGCCPGEFGKGEFVCPEGGKYSLSADGMTGVCSHHGSSSFLTPCCEIPVQTVSLAEAREYEQFLEEYNAYWRTFFDPIALRIQTTPKGYRAETIVLPLIDNTIYSQLAQILGGKPEPLDALPVPTRNIFSVAARLDKRALLASAGMEELLPETREGKLDESKAHGPDTVGMANRMKEIGLAMHNYHAPFNGFPSAMRFDKKGKRAGLSWRVAILPYLEQDALYKKFRLDEPWDSPHNKKLIAEMPAIYRPADAKLAAAGKTRLVAPLGDKVFLPRENTKRTLASIRDGTSNTIMMVEADDDHAVIWTKPDDLEVDLKKPLAGLAMRAPEAFLVLLGDGTVRFLRKSIKTETAAALFTVAGGEVVDISSREEVFLGINRGGPDNVIPEFVHRLNGGELLARGLGNQIGLHVCDAETMFDFNLPTALGLALGSFNGRRNIGGPDSLQIAAIVASLQSPVYVSLPVQDARVVDAFLTRLDDYLTEVSRDRSGWEGPIQIRQDFYRFAGPQAKHVRGYAFTFGPLTWRLFWGRIGKGLYIASKPFILEDLLAASEKQEQTPPAAQGPEAHGLIRLRPRHWNRVLADYRLGWAECNRQACQHNLGPLSSLHRALGEGKPSDDVEKSLRLAGMRLFGVQFFCPDAGRYVTSPDGKTVTCSIHGSATSARQPMVPSDKSSANRLMSELADVTLALTFLEDGLHAVVTIERK